MSQIDIRGASIDALAKHIGHQLKLYAKKEPGGITALAESSGVSRSTLNRLFSGQAVGLDSLLRVLRVLERYDILHLLCQTPSLTPIEKLEILQPQRKLKRRKSPPDTNSRYSHVKMADSEAIKASLRKRDD